MGTDQNIEKWNSDKSQNAEYFKTVTIPELSKKYKIYLLDKNSYRIVCEHDYSKLDFYPLRGRLFDHRSKKWLTVANKEDVLMTITELL